MKSIKKNIVLALAMTLIISASAYSQVLPAKIKKYLDDNYTSAESGAWKKAPGNCDGSKWLLTGDFNGDGRSDHLVRITNGKGADQQLHLVAFINEKGGYTPDTIIVRAGRPVRLNFRREETASCSDTVIFADFQKSVELPTGETVPVELMPKESGEFTFACPMGMLRGRLVVE